MGNNFFLELRRYLVILIWKVYPKDLKVTTICANVHVMTILSIDIVLYMPLVFDYTSKHVHFLKAVSRF